MTENILARLRSEHSYGLSTLVHNVPLDCPTLLDCPDAELKALLLLLLYTNLKLMYLLAT